MASYFWLEAVIPPVEAIEGCEREIAMQNSYTRLHRGIVAHHAESKRRSREKIGEVLFHVFLLGALCWHAFGGLTMLQNSIHTAQFFDGPIYVGLGALTYSTGWWLRYSLTGWRGLL